MIKPRVTALTYLHAFTIHRFNLQYFPSGEIENVARQGIMPSVKGETMRKGSRTITIFAETLIEAGIERGKKNVCTQNASGYYLP